MPIDWSIPAPSQVVLREDMEDGSTRWQGSAVLLAWPATTTSEATRPATTTSEAAPCPFDLQAREEVEDQPVFGFKSVSWTRIRLSDVDHVAVTDLSFDACRFRWCLPDSKVPGPVSDLCIARLHATLAPSAEAFCTPSAVRVRLRVALPKPHGGSQQAAYFRVRHRIPPSITSAPAWHALPVRALVKEAGAVVIDVALGEEDGLEQGALHVFCVQLSAECGRRSQWSDASPPLLFDAPVACGGPSEGATLEVRAAALTTVTFRWPELVPPEVFTANGLTPVGRPVLECRVDVYRCLQDGGTQHRTSALAETADGVPPMEAIVYNLAPSTEYKAELSARFLRLGTRRWHSTGLVASFVTPTKAMAEAEAAAISPEQRPLRRLGGP